MVASALFFVRYALVLLYGIVLSAAFAGVEATRRNALILGALFALCGIAQVVVLVTCNETLVWYTYPLLGHAPLVALLCIHYRKRILTALAAVTTAYLCCQPVKWVAETVDTFTSNPALAQAAAIIALVILGFFAARDASESLSSLFNRENRDVLVFCMVPFTYYVFDYAVSVYSDLWSSYSGAVAEFLPAVLCLAFTISCVAYHRVIEEKARLEERDRLIAIAIEQQTREVEAVRRGEKEMRLLRHDMRLLLNNVSRCLDEGDVENARKMLSGYVEDIDATKVQRWCGNDIVNYIIADCHSRCEAKGIAFEPAVEIAELPVDELTFASILSNALDNAINAQEKLPADQRRIKLSIKISNGRLLLSMKNSCLAAPRFVDGMPVTKEAGHGYGTQSIRYMTERLGGSCQFSAEGGQFLLRVAAEL
ncbi:MAG: sensor histidine kinase [Eggerthellaceae bacterium]|nr:sensor histidine kinase [Eggerthellaceae bacterium]